MPSPLAAASGMDALSHCAASRAGMAINNSSAGLAHAVAQAGPRLGLPLGLACALALPATVARQQAFHGEAA